MSSFGQELPEKKHFENADRHPDILTDRQTQEVILMVAKAERS